MKIEEISWKIRTVKKRMGGKGGLKGKIINPGAQTNRSSRKRIEKLKGGYLSMKYVLVRSLLGMAGGSVS